MTTSKQSGVMRFLKTAGNLKRNTRHSWQKDGRQESIAEHCSRLTLMALTLREEMDIDYGKILELCALHDVGEALTGDIPSFLKKDADEDLETELTLRYIKDTLPERVGERLCALYLEAAEHTTKEGRYFKALDKLEAVMQHNESGAETWLELEFELQKTYGIQECAEFSELDRLRQEALEETLRIIEEYENKNR